MRSHLVMALLFVSTPLLAQRAKVLILDPDIETKELEKPYEVQRPRQAYALPDKYVRDKILDGIDSVNGWDELKKDIFYMDLHSKKLSDLKKKYPDVSDKEFKKLQGRIR